MDIGEIQNVTDSLALMPDAALQKYAMMNKDDPYIMSLAMSENNRRKKIRTAQQGQAGQMPQPKVVDQAIQSINPPPPQPQPMPPQGMPPQGAPQQPQPMPPQGMPQAQQQLPEQQGIAQLPAPNMQGMADGGIVGYAVGGAPTPAAFGKFLRTQGVNPPDFSRLPSAAQETLKRLFSNATMGPQMPTPVPTAPTVAAAAAEQPGLPYRIGQSVAQGAKKVGNFISEGSPRLGVGLAALLTPSNEGQDTRQDEMLAAVRGEGYKGKPYNKEAAAALLKEMGLDPARAPDKAAPVVKPAVLAPTGADQGRGGRGGPLQEELIAAGKARDGAAAAPDTGIGRPPADESRANTQGGLPTLATATTLADAAAELNAIKSAQTPSVPTEISSALEDIGTAKRTAIDAEETQRQKDLKAMGPAFADREARLKQKQSRVDQQERDVAPMALMEAGFAMMSGTSPHALSNIGAGALIGTKTYKAGLEKIEDARDKLDDAFGRIEEFRRSENMMDAKEKRRHARELSDTFTETKKAYTDVLVKDWGVKQDDARVIYSSVVAERQKLNDQKFQAGENAANRANASANARLQASSRADPLALYEELADPTSKVAKGYAAAKQETIEPTLFAQYEKAAADTTVSLNGKYLTKGEEFTAKYPNAQAYVKAYRNALGSEGTIPPAGGKDFLYIGSRPLK